MDTRDTGEVSYIANTRMHLTQSQVKQIMPILQKFVETGEIIEVKEPTKEATE